MIDFTKYDIRNIYEIADIERAIKGKRYKAGSTLIELSATKGNIEYLEKEGEIDTRYAVITPRIECFPRYIYISIQETLPEFIAKYLTGINLQESSLKHLAIKVHSLETQSFIVQSVQAIDGAIAGTKKEIEKIKDIKSNMLESLFV